MTNPISVDRRTTLKWVLTAASSLPLLTRPLRGVAAENAPAPPRGSPYGRDPDLLRTYAPGDLWPLRLTATEKRAATALCDLIIPADSVSPSASAVGVIGFIDEWVSAPYPAHEADHALVSGGLAWLDAQSMKAHGRDFAALTSEEQRGLCDPICYRPKAAADLDEAAHFFARFRDLTSGAFYTTPEGTRDLGFVGNVALERFDGPSKDVLKQAGLL